MRERKFRLILNFGLDKTRNGYNDVTNKFSKVIHEYSWVIPEMNRIAKYTTKMALVS